MNNLEEQTKIAKETRWAVLVRTLADNEAAGKSSAIQRRELAMLRRLEQESGNHLTSLAAIGRQIGDAINADRDTSALVAAAVDLRRRELTGKRPKK